MSDALNWPISGVHIQEAVQHSPQTFSYVGLFHLFAISQLCNMPRLASVTVTTFPVEILKHLLAGLRKPLFIKKAYEKKVKLVIFYLGVQFITYNFQQGIPQHSG